MNIFASEIYFQDRRVKPPTSRKKIVLILGFFSFLIILFFLLVPPFHTNSVTVSIPEGAGSQAIGKLLREEGVIRAPALFSIVVSMISSPTALQAGDYLFTKPVSLVTAVRRVTHGEYGTVQLKVTFPEGISVRDMRAIIEKVIPEFDGEQFETLALPHQGTLFPNTYYLSKRVTPENLVKLLTDTFEKEYLTLSLDTPTNRSKKDIVIMASILEREARNKEEAQIISGILWGRLDRGMPLQADATVAFGAGKLGSQLTANDLVTDGPYNTYTRTGLPVGPIGNPGRDMLYAALNPRKTDNVYYIHASDGAVYYAKTLEEHNENIRRYLTR